MQSKKTIVLIIFLVLGVSIQSYGQVDTVNLKGKWALQFQVTENFTLGNFQGSAFSGKFHFNKHSAIRVGVDISTYSDKYNISTENIQADTINLSGHSVQAGENNIKINLQYLYYNTISNSISMFIGAGLSHTTRPTYRREVNNENQLQKFSITHSGYGLDLIMGVEWFVRSNIGILAEYNSGYSYFESTSTITLFENDDIDDEISGENYLAKTTTSYSSSSFNNHKVKFGVSVYF